MRTPLYSVALGALMWSVATCAVAVKSGRVTNLTVLGQPLDFSVSVKPEGDESITAGCMSAEVFVGEDKVARSGVFLSVSESASVAERIVRVATVMPIDEPLVKINLLFECPHRLVRQFLVFVDPLAAELVSAGAASMPQTEPGFARLVLKSGPSRRVRRAQESVPPVAVASGAFAEREVRGSAKLPAASSRPRDDAKLARTRTELSQQNSADQERSPAPQETRDFDLPRDEMQFAQARSAQAQARLSAADGGSDTNPLVLLLAALIAVFGAVVGLLLWKVAIDAAQPDTPALPSPEPQTGVKAAPNATESQHVDAQPRDVKEVVKPPTPSAIPAVLTSLAPPLGRTEAEQADEMSVEDLIDLVGVVDTLVLQGHDQTAIDVLLKFLRTTGERRPLPFLQLLEIYKRRGDRKAHEQLRRRFNERFNTYAPDWEFNPRYRRSLEDYPTILAALQALWNMPRSVVQAIKMMLMRTEAGGGTFDLPAYRDLLMLYQVAHDLVISSVLAPGVDLYLPTGGGKSDVQSED